jgi:hypothetical protein
VNTYNEKTQSHFRPSPHKIGFDGARAFKEMGEAFRETLNAKPNVLWQSHCSFAGHTGQIRILGKHLASCISQPFRHLLFEEKAVSAPQLTINLWDVNETDMPSPIDVTDAVLESTANHQFILGSPNDRFVGCQSPQMITCFDRATGRIVGCTLNSHRLSINECVKPLNFPLLLWHSDRNSPIVHAGLVSYRDQGVLFAGREGAGKSTSAMACVTAGFNYLGDNFIALKRLHNGRVDGYSVHNTFWLEPNQMLHFPFLVSHAKQRETPKWPILLSHVFPERLARVAPVCAILLPRIQDRPIARIYPASTRDALFALTPSSMVQLPVSGVRSLNTIAHLVENVACYWLELGHRLETIPLRVTELLDDIRTRN